MIEDKDYVTEEVAEDLLDLIREYEQELKQLHEREHTLFDSLQASMGKEQAEQLKEYISVRLDTALRLFELDLRTRYTNEESAAAKAVDKIFKTYE
ncbi:MAG: hypothetical protein ACXVIG_03080 [Halobacteriota archaeon]